VFESVAEGHDSATEDPLLIQRFGELAIRVRAADTLLSTAAQSVDAARADLTDDSAAAASIAVAAAKVTAAEAAVEIGSALFEASGTRSALDSPWACTATGVTPVITPSLVPAHQRRQPSGRRR
jgi:alkylation response protein AidB-like acyl-CoA dehydrogenase